MPSSSSDTVIAYHQATKHHLQRYARSAGYMDWANQPDPFRRYDDVVQISLPLGAASGNPSFADLFRFPGGRPRPLSLAAVGAFLELSLGLSAWKVAGASRWSLRINPSSGNLHPTEGHLILPPMKDLPGGIFHYTPLHPALEQRAQFSGHQWAALAKLFDGPGFMLALTTIFWRESWKYGERAYRYCSLDIGHALAAIEFAARLHSWRPICLTGVGDDQIRDLLGFGHVPWHPLEEEIPEVLCWISLDPEAKPPASRLPSSLMKMLNGLSFSGRPQILSARPVPWPIIEQVSRATVRPSSGSAAPITQGSPVADPHTSWGRWPAATIIRTRRSAVRFDAHKSTLTLDKFKAMLAMTITSSGDSPLAVAPHAPAVDLLLFVHRVSDLEPGLYLLLRTPGRREILQASIQREFEWRRVWPGFDFWRLQAGDLAFEAMEASCHQDIAAQGAFAAAMLAHFEPLLRSAPHAYRYLHWECGMIGQVLYLTAEACGLRGTGMGCFFDDEVHRLMAIRDLTFQVLYHFTVGYPVEDNRLTTLPAYHHLGHR